MNEQYNFEEILDYLYENRSARDSEKITSLCDFYYERGYLTEKQTALVINIYKFIHNRKNIIKTCSDIRENKQSPF